MTHRRCTRCLLTLVGVLGLGLPTLLAQASAPPVSADVHSPPALIPPLPQCPIEFFRNLLSMDPSERRRALRNRTPESQRKIMAKVREYQQLSPEARELRLRATELRWYLLPLMRASTNDRPAQLAQIPSEPLRQLVADRLKIWDGLPPDAQKRLLQPILDALSKPPVDPLAPKAAPGLRFASERSADLQSGVRDWRNMSEAGREEIVSRFKEFFNLTPAEQAKTLNTLSGPEQRQIERTLRTFGTLSPRQRAVCIRSFQKFADMSVAERQEFLKNAERWNQMTPSERQAWKDLVYNLQRQPPLPPGLNSPPLPPRLHPPFPRTVATNGN